MGRQAGGGLRLHLGSTGFANLGDGVFQAGIPLVALTLTRSPAQISALSAAMWLPWFAVGLAAGVVLDRRDRLATRAIALGTRAVLLGGGAVLAALGRLTIAALIAIALCYGTTEVFADLAGSSILPDLVPRDGLHAANGRVLAVEKIANTFLGPPLAGLVLGLGAAWVVGLPAATAAVALALALQIHGVSRPEEPAGNASGREQLVGGLRYVARDPTLRPLLLASGGMNMASTAYMAVVVLWAVGDGSRIGMAPAHWPLVLAVMAVGALAGSMLAAPAARRVPELTLLRGAWLALGPLLLAPVLAPTIPVLVSDAFLLGLANAAAAVIGQSLRQRVTPAALLGRVMGATRTLGYGLTPVGALAGGQVAEHLGLAPALVGSALGTLLAAAYPAFLLRRATVAAAEAAAVSRAAGA